MSTTSRAVAPRRRLTCACIALLLVVLVAASCSSSPTASEGPTATRAPSGRSTTDGLPDACSLLTADKVARSLSEHSSDGGAYTAELVDDPAGENACTVRWRRGGAGDEFTISVFDADGYVADPSGPGPRPIAGIGDEAFEVDGSFRAAGSRSMVWAPEDRPAKQTIPAGAVWAMASRTRVPTPVHSTMTSAGSQASLRGPWW
jgi:hypothetical protein